MIKVGEEIEIVGIKDTKKTVATGVEMFRKLLDQGIAGDNIGVLLRGVDKEKCSAVRCCASPAALHPTRKFKSEAYILTKEEGGQAYAVLHGVSAAVLFQNHGCDWSDDVEAWC